MLKKLLDRAKSSRVWATVAGNVFAVTDVQDGWPRAAVIIVVNVAYVVSETLLKKWKCNEQPS